MEIVVKYLYNQTSNSSISSGIEIMYLPEYDYEEIESSREKEEELVKEITNYLIREYSYYSVKVTSFSEA